MPCTIVYSMSGSLRYKFCEGNMEEVTRPGGDYDFLKGCWSASILFCGEKALLARQWLDVPEHKSRPVTELMEYLNKDKNL